MNKHEADRLIAVIRELAAEEATDSVKKGPRRVAGMRESTREAFEATEGAAGANGDGVAGIDPDLLERLFYSFKNRLIDELRLDPVFVQLLAVQRELEVVIEPRVVTLEGNTLRGRVARLIGDGWFNHPKATGTTRKELARTGPDPGGGGSLSDVLTSFVKDGFLVRNGGEYEKAAGLKVTERHVEAR